MPAVIASEATQRMKEHSLDFLGSDNKGWSIINKIHQGLEKGNSAAKFKRIGMEHYLHCLKCRIANHDFDVT
ncbi:MAG: hypothetical protein IPO83_01815 [Chitinophagaceae bacterium]|nr:hypothetical protein [Chitinophagaceae bacterium]